MTDPSADIDQLVKKLVQARLADGHRLRERVVRLLEGVTLK